MASRAIAAATLCLALPAAAQQARQTVCNAPLIERFDDGFDESRWWRTDDRVGAKRINDTGYSAGNIAIADGEMTLRLDPSPYRDRAHTGASLKSRNLHGYGRYDAVMKAARGSGVVSAFYTYTGPPYGDPHDEIDFEFLGRDPRLVHLNYFVAGEAKLKRTIELDFDISENFHLYTILWKPGEIVWLIDGVELHRAVGEESDMPRHPGKAIAEIWAAKGLKRWAGEIDPRALPATASVRCLSFRPLGSDAPTCADTVEDAS